ncbi:23S rRNA (uracil1939-C5)-methyltransferase [Verrucomicrobium sp. GAS474]|uniref:class I SAM-dependent RNA methyltransferase n=1 Tax=Verrucomicrobium sp. GAS474 TaxID=1882831 RepID=UPI00087DDF9F|nr:class I SAM-dependent RNA methyltransferase [Verrucomicrobium sp. GAS474]SDT98461.1 23S rRNA (uracil1939-C5)-methyltransferase [Verrucomicrobium sp. GAS474]
MSTDSPHLTLTIDSLAFGGEGIARDNGRVVFVPFTAPGDVVEVRITEAKKTFARGEVVQVVTPGPDRAAAPCPYYGPKRCGGCQYQHLTYEAELKAKAGHVAEALTRIGKLTLAAGTIEPIVPSPQPYGYRNRITVHRSENGKGDKIGFHRAESHDIIDIPHCLIAAPEVNDALGALRRQELAPKRGRAVNFTRPTHFSLRHPDLPPSAFHQVNLFLLGPLRDLVAGWVGTGRRLVEGYCGGGFFTEVLAPHFASITAIEFDSRSLRDARRKTLINVAWIEGSVEECLGAALAASGAEGTDALLLDPPREGLAPGVVTAILAAEQPPRRIVYVSCNPATLARDGGKLSARYTLARVQPLDLFPRTAQVESITLWELKA